MNFYPKDQANVHNDKIFFQQIVIFWIKLIERNLVFLIFSFATSNFLDLEIQSVLNDISYWPNEMERIFISEFNQVRDMKITSLKFDFFETIYSI